MNQNHGVTKGAVIQKAFNAIVKLNEYKNEVHEKSFKEDNNKTKPNRSLKLIQYPSNNTRKKAAQDSRHKVSIKSFGHF